MHCHFQDSGPVVRFNHDGDSRQVLAACGIGLLVRGVKGHGEHRVVAGIGPAQHDQGLF
ncbi:hypothetical protein AHiyo1_02470 [Arthrobacter sp. Hiyo1]|nr:hypothetical protein AHiyo1_02470 [Arthrobacter sp. Hiyo1]